MSPPGLPSPAFQKSVWPGVRFKVVFEIGQGDEVKLLRTSVPRDESYEKFLGRLDHIFSGDSFERSLRQWEYVLANWRYEKGDPLPLTSPNTYYAMVSELLKPGSRWKHAIVRRSHPVNPIIEATAEETFHQTPDPPIISAPASDIPISRDLPTPDGAQSGISTVDPAPVDDASQLDGPVVEETMSDTENDQATPEPLTSIPHSKAPFERAQSLTIPSSSAPTPAASMQVRQTETLSRIGSPSMLHGTTTSPGAEMKESSPPVAIALHSPAVSPVVSGSTSSSTVASDLFQRRLNLPPEPTSNSSSSLEASQTQPTPVPRPRRPLWIISRQHVNSTVEYQVHWNSGRTSWEPHDSLYRDHPLLIENFLKGRH